MRRSTALLVIALFLGLTALLTLACGGGSDSSPANGTAEAIGSATDAAAAQTAELHNAPASLEPNAGQHDDEDEEDKDEEAQDSVRDLHASGQRLPNLARRLRADVESAPPPNTPPEGGGARDWFAGCCEGAAEDIYDELKDVDDEAQQLVTLYQGAGRDADALVAARVAGEAANTRAALDALADAPDPEAAAPLLEAVDAAVGALNDAIDALTACCA